MFSTSALTVPAPDLGRVNEDLFVAGPNWWIVLDGATAPESRNSGCIHDVPWLVHLLAARLSYDLTVGTHLPLTAVLDGAIRHVCFAHADTCDLENPDSPSSTVAIARTKNTGIEYLALADSPLLVETESGGIELVHDDRTAYLTDRTYEGVSRARNAPGGFWVASTKPEAAENALTGYIADVRSFSLLTDGASRWTELFQRGDWIDLHKVIAANGLQRVIDEVRAAEIDPNEPKKGKQHDDATIVFANR